MAFKTIVDAINGNRVVVRLKILRNRALYSLFQLKGRSEGRLFAARLQQPQYSRVCFAIAFNTPWAIDALTKAWELCPPGMALAIIDNSTDAESRRSIESICARRNVPYLGLPRRRERHGSRSHGGAITWTFHNVVKHLRPELFGFIDHDCFPVVPFDISDKLDGKAVYGLKSPAIENFAYKAAAGEHLWTLWAGFCFYRFAAVAHLDLNFEPRPGLGMDTGGANWQILYSKLRDTEVATAALDRTPITLSGSTGNHELLDGAFLHLGGSSYAERVTRHHRSKEHRKMLRDYLWDTYLAGSAGQIASDF